MKPHGIRLSLGRSTHPPARLTARLTARVTAGLVGGSLCLVLAGCAAPTEEQPRTAVSSTPNHPAAASSAKPQPAESKRPMPSESPTGTSTGTSSGTSAPARATLTARLLTSSQMPGFDAGFAWQDAGTRGAEGAEPFATCHRYLMTSIGATRVVVREFTPEQGPGTATASHLVAEFPDGSTARRAYAVLEAWRGTCGARLSSYDRHEVGGLRTVDVAGGTGAWYLLTYGPTSGSNRDDDYLDAQGLTRVGSLLSVLQMRMTGQDDDYPAGKAPMVAAVRAAAAKLG